jgi:two-component system chemotaxis sensor kinase CheA
VDASQYADLFLTESREHLSAINLALLDLERLVTLAGAADAPVRHPPAGGEPADPGADAHSATVGSLFRAVHTIKGMSATMGYDAVARLSHEMETLLDRLRTGAISAHPGLLEALFTAADTLESSIERAVVARPADPRVDAVVERLRSLAVVSNGKQSAGAGTTTRRVPSVSPRTRSPARGAPARRAPGRGAVKRGSPTRPSKTGRRSAVPRAAAVQKDRGGAGSGQTREPGDTLVRIHFVPDAPLRGARAAVALHRARALGEVTAITPDPETFAQDGSGPIVLELLMRTDAPLSAIEHQLRNVGDVAHVDVVRPAPRRDRAARASRPSRQVPAESNGSSGAAPGGAGAAAPRPARIPRRTITVPAAAAAGMPGSTRDNASRGRHVRIDLGRLDALMNLIGELVIARGRLIELTSNQGESPLGEAVSVAGRLIGNLQEEIMTCRMVPVWQVFDRFPRLVRDAAHSLNKQVAFEVEGKDIELDRSMLDEIGDPIVHLLRNAVDHGIEAPDVRAAAGKPPQGRLTLSAGRDRSAVLIRVTDDGRGIDRAKVLARAVESGLVDPATTELTDEQVIRLIARPGFTTADQVTDLSGRGVGIDAVQARVRALGGSVDIKSIPGQGTTVTARLPLTLAIMRALLARVGPESYAFPMAHIDETVATGGATFAAVRGRPVLVLRGEAIPYLRMREIVGLPAPGPGAPADDGEQHIIVLESAGKRTAVAVDELTGQEDIVVKQYDSVRGGAALFSGATILGDGAPALIVDVSSLF